MGDDLRQLIDQVRSLSREDQERIRQTLDAELSRAGRTASDPEEAFWRRLVAAGLLKEAKPPVRDAERFRTWTPVCVQGKPLSESIMEARR